MRALALAVALAALAACADEAPERATVDPAPQDSVAPATQVAVLPGLEDRAGWRALIRWPDDCEERRRETVAAEMGAGIEVDSLGGGRHLVQVLCFPGAYQPGKLVFVHGPGTASAPLRLPGYADGATSAEDSIPYVNGLTTFDRAARELEVFSKSRGVGDCGKLIRFAFPEGVPTVKWQRARECGAAEPPVMEPHQWPLVPPDSSAQAE